MNDNVLLGISGGVDSSAAAIILKESGYFVSAAHLLLTKDSHTGSASETDAKNTAQALGLPYYVCDCREEFTNYVVNYFTDEYLAGRTPNPCIVCNPLVKFASLIKEADRLGIEKIATGHYAKTVFSEKYRRPFILASQAKKDQSYFLWRLDAQTIGRTLFPLGDFMSKDEIREKAAKYSLPAAGKKDSLEICFIPDNDYPAFLKKETGIDPLPGDFVDTNGNVIGRHGGIINYTVGQRKGLGAFGEPKYVRKIDAAANTVTLCSKDGAYGKTVFCDIFSLPSETPAVFEAKVKVRSTMPAADAQITKNRDRLTVEFSGSVLLPPPGQSAVIYEDGMVIGGGIISEG